MDEDAARRLHELEQSLATMSENLPPMWMRVYRNCIAAGFSEDMAIRMILTMIHGTFGGKLSP